MKTKQQSTNNNFIVFHIEDNLVENLKGFDDKKTARQYFEQQLLKKDVPRKDITDALKSDIYMEANFTVNIVELD
jgi:hypothetical protein